MAINNNRLREIIREVINKEISAYDIREFSKEKDSSSWQYVEEHKNEIWDFINKGYQEAGYEKFCGCDNARSLFKNANLIKIAFCNEEWVAICVYTGYRGGYKCVGITATTNSNLRSVGIEAVKEMIKLNVTQYDEFYWTECSGSIEHLYEKYNGIKIPNEYVTSILQKPVTLLNDGFHYERFVKGDTQQKIIYGFNDQETFDRVKREHTEYINQCIQLILNSQINEDVEKPSFGRLSKVQCSVAIINFFVDLRWEEECYDLSSESLDILIKNVKYLKSVVNQLPQNQQIQQAIENGEDLINTTSVMTIQKL